MTAAAFSLRLNFSYCNLMPVHSYFSFDFISNTNFFSEFLTPVALAAGSVYKPCSQYMTPPRQSDHSNVKYTYPTIFPAFSATTKRPKSGSGIIFLTAHILFFKSCFVLWQYSLKSGSIYFISLPFASLETTFDEVAYFFDSLGYFFLEICFFVGFFCFDAIFLTALAIAYLI